MTRADVDSCTILRCTVGSEAYGLSTDASDKDEKGVCVEPFEVFCGLGGEFEQFEYRTAAERTGQHDAKSEIGDLDLTVYSLRKFLRLATYGNPNIIELLFLKKPHVLKGDARGMRLQELYGSIVSRQCGRRYLGYMEAQKQRLLGERGQMRVTRTELIGKHGYDTKYALHVLRLGFQGVELLETGKLVLPIEEPTHSILAEVKAGRQTLDYVLQTVGDLELKLRDLVKDGPIQPAPDMNTVEAWMQHVYWQTWRAGRYAADRLRLEDDRLVPYVAENA